MPVVVLAGGGAVFEVDEVEDGEALVGERNVVVQDDAGIEAEGGAAAFGFGGGEGGAREVAAGVLREGDAQVRVANHVEEEERRGRPFRRQLAGGAPRAVESVPRAVVLGAFFAVEEEEDKVGALRSALQRAREFQQEADAGRGIVRAREAGDAAFRVVVRRENRARIPSPAEAGFDVAEGF